MFLYAPIIHLDVLVEMPGRLTRRETWRFTPRHYDEEINTTFLSLGPFEVAWSWLDAHQKAPEGGWKWAPWGLLGLGGVIWAFL